MNQIVPSADVMQQAREHAPEIKPLHFIQCLRTDETMVWLNPSLIASVEFCKSRVGNSVEPAWLARVHMSNGERHHFHLLGFQEATKQFFPSA